MAVKGFVYFIPCYYEKLWELNICSIFQAIFKERDEERERLRRELQRSQEQVHALLSQSAASHRASSGNLSSAAVSATISDDQNNIANQAATSSQESRPLSYISVEESSGPEMSEKNPESEDDGKFFCFVWICLL